MSGADPNPNVVGSNLSASVIYSSVSSALSMTSYCECEPWHVHDGKAHGIITQHLNDHNVLTYASCPTSKDLFDHIIHKYEGTNIGVNVFYTFTTTMGCKYINGTSIDNHVSFLTSNSHRLISMNKALDDKFLAYLLLHSLPSTSAWETFKSSVLNSLPTNSKLTFENASDHLQAEATCIRGDAITGANVESEMKAESKWCDFHKVNSHYTKDCCMLKQKGEGKSKRKKKGRVKPSKKRRRNEKAHKADSDLGSKSESSSDDSSSDDGHAHKATASIVKAKDGTLIVNRYMYLKP